MACAYDTALLRYINEKSFVQEYRESIQRSVMHAHEGAIPITSVPFHYPLSSSVPQLHRCLGGTVDIERHPVQDEAYQYAPSLRGIVSFCCQDYQPSMEQSDKVRASWCTKRRKKKKTHSQSLQEQCIAVSSLSRTRQRALFVSFKETCFLSQLRHEEISTVRFLAHTLLQNFNNFDFIVFIVAAIQQIDC